jgi:NarL family two-component system response regulator LiaR
MADMNPIRVMIVDDHLMVRDGLRVFLSVHEDIQVVAEAEDGKEAVSISQQDKPDVILMDLLMPNMDGFEAIRLILEEDSTTRIIALTSFAEKDLIEKAFKAGATSFVLKDVHSDKLAETIREAYQGRTMIDSTAAQVLIAAVNQSPKTGKDLTNREREILALLIEGKTNKEIAKMLSLSSGTVRFHISNILSKLGVSNRTEAVSQALQLGLV